MPVAGALECSSVVDPDALDTFVAASPQGCFWSSPLWSRIVSSAFGGTVEHLVCRDGGEIVAACGLAVRRRHGFALARRPFATPFAGILLGASVPPPVALAATRALADYLVQRFDLVELTQHPRFVWHQCLAEKGWRHDVRATYVVDIASPARAWRSFDCDLRNTIRKAERTVEVRESDDAAAFFRLYEATFSRMAIGISVRPESVATMLCALRDADRGRLYLALDRAGSPCAGAIATWDQSTAYYHLAASDPILRRTGAVSLLLWTMIQDLSVRVGTLDLVGANIPSIARFKEQFRPTLVPYVASRCYAGPWASLRHRVYRRWSP